VSRDSLVSPSSASDSLVNVGEEAFTSGRPAQKLADAIDLTLFTG
jgi:hypothetical protein